MRRHLAVDEYVLVTAWSGSRRISGADVCMEQIVSDLEPGLDTMEEEQAADVGGGVKFVPPSRHPAAQPFLAELAVLEARLQLWARQRRSLQRQSDGRVSITLADDEPCLSRFYIRLCRTLRRLRLCCVRWQPIRARRVEWSDVQRTQMEDLAAVLWVFVCNFRRTSSNDESFRRRLHQQAEEMKDLYASPYEDQARFIAKDLRFEEACAAAEQLVPDVTDVVQALPRGGSAGMMFLPSLVDLVEAAVEAQQRLNSYVHDLMHGQHGLVHGVGQSHEKVKRGFGKPKRVFRILEKVALSSRVSEHRGSLLQRVCDCARESLIFPDMTSMLCCLAILRRHSDEGKIVIHRVKQRFRKSPDGPAAGCGPTNGGWRDILVNLSFGSDGDCDHVCEMQLSHMRLYTMRAGEEFGGHQAFAAFRFADELLEWHSAMQLVLGDMLMPLVCEPLHLPENILGGGCIAVVQHGVLPGAPELVGLHDQNHCSAKGDDKFDLHEAHLILPRSMPVHGVSCKPIPLEDLFGVLLPCQSQLAPGI